MEGAAIAKGLKFKIGNRKIRIWKNGMEIGTERGGRVYFFPWHPKFGWLNRKDQK